MTYHPSRLKPVRRKRATEEMLPPFERKGDRPLPHKMYVLERRKQATLLRIAGLSNTEIGSQLHADPAANTTGKSFVGGYGWTKWVRGEPPLSGKGLIQAVSVDLSQHFQWAESSFAETQDLHRQMELERLDKLQRGIWQRATNGDDWAIDRVLQIVDRRMKLLGLEMRTVDVNARIEANVHHHDRLPEVDAGYAQAMLDGLAELTQGTDDSVDAEVIDVEPID